MSILLHAFIGIIVILVFEVCGYFIFKGVLNISPDRVDAAKFIFQFMIVSTFFTIISVPYEAMITSNENMFFYAIEGIIEAVFKLVIAFFILYTANDHLKLYGLLTAILTIFLLILRRVYCNLKYKECKISFREYFDRDLLNEMSSFASWSFLGSVSSIVSNYGQGIVLNVFFGTIVNAAQGISNQISGQLGAIVTVLQKALNPVISKSEGAGNRVLMHKATMLGTKVSFFLLMITFIPMWIEMPYIFKFWLKEIPAFTIIFCRLLLLRNLLDQFTNTLIVSISAVGNIKTFQIFNSLLSFLPLLITYFLFKNGFQPYYMYVSFILYSLFLNIIVIYFAKKTTGLSVKNFINNVILRCLLTLVIVLSVTYVPYFFLKTSLTKLLCITVSEIAVAFVSVYFIGINSEERLKFKNIIQIGLVKLKFK